MPGTEELIIRAAIETLMLMAALWLMFAHFGLSSHLRVLGRGRASVVVAFLITWTAVHLVDRWQYFYPQPASFYPLARFAMYQIGQPNETIDTYGFVAHYADSSIEELNLTQHFRSVGLPSLHTRMSTLSAWLREGGTGADRARGELAGYSEGIRTLLSESGRPVPVEVRFVAKWYQVDTGRLVGDTVLWMSRNDTTELE